MPSRPIRTKDESASVGATARQTVVYRKVHVLRHYERTRISPAEAPSAIAHATVSRCSFIKFSDLFTVPLLLPRNAVLDSSSS